MIVKILPRGALGGGRLGVECPYRHSYTSRDFFAITFQEPAWKLTDR